MMCEIPSNAVLAKDFLQYFDGFSIGSNDLTQLTLGLDRDSGLELLAHDFDERDPAVKALLKMAIGACKAEGKYVGICGQGPSDHPDFAQWLRDEGISSISLNPDSVVDTWQLLARPARSERSALRRLTQSGSGQPCRFFHGHASRQREVSAGAQWSRRPPAVSVCGGRSRRQPCSKALTPNAWWPCSSPAAALFNFPLLALWDHDARVLGPAPVSRWRCS